MKKNTAKILMAVLCLMMAIGIATGSTFAWFSLNNRVTVTGMTVTTKVGNSLQIAADELSSTAKLADSNFSNGINQPVVGLLEPASTTDGKAFFYNSTANVKANGDAIADTYLAYATTGLAAATDSTTYGNKFSENYMISKTAATAATGTKNIAEGYVDYVFQLKATNTLGNGTALKMTKLNLLYNDAASSADENKDVKAFRVAVFVEDITAGTATAAPGTLKTILAYSGAAYQTLDNEDKGCAISAVDAAPTTVSNFGTAATLDTFTQNETKYYKVVVRMWLEGEDTTCNNETFMSLTSAWTLDLAIELGGANSAVTSIGSAANLTVAAAGAVATLTIADTSLSATSVVKTYQWYKVGSPDAAVDAASNASAATAEFTATEAGNYYCIVTAYGSQYRSPTVALTAPTP